MSKLTEEQIIEMEREYYKNRKEIILNEMGKAKLCDKLNNITYGTVAIFGASMVLSGLSIITKTDLSPVFSESLALVAGLSGFTTVGIGAYSDFLEKEVNDTAKEIKQKDAILRYKDEMNSNYMRNLLEIINPRLFKKVSKSKLTNPINMVTFANLDKKDQDQLIEESKFSIELDEMDGDYEVIDLIELDNKEILEEAKRRRLISRRHK